LELGPGGNVDHRIREVRVLFFFAESVASIGHWRGERIMGVIVTKRSRHKRFSLHERGIATDTLDSRFQFKRGAIGRVGLGKIGRFGEKGATDNKRIENKYLQGQEKKRH